MTFLKPAWFTLSKFSLWTVISAWRSQPDDWSRYMQISTHYHYIDIKETIDSVLKYHILEPT
jgi:hypothetical protein